MKTTYNTATDTRLFVSWDAPIDLWWDLFGLVWRCIALHEQLFQRDQVIRSLWSTP